MTNMDPSSEKTPSDLNGPSRHKTPRWVKGFLMAAAVIVVAFAVMHLSGGMVMNHTP